MTDAPVRVIDRAEDLPREWDAAAGDNLFLQKDALTVLERTNPCSQRYHITDSQQEASIAVTYQHRLNLLTFGSGALRIPVTIIGIPCSVSSGGTAFSPETREALTSHLGAIRGTKLMLNTDGSAVEGFLPGLTLPSSHLDLRWKSFSAYLDDMRSHYRYRIAKAQSRWRNVTAAPLDRDSFSQSHHALYENVFKRSHYQLEELGPDFFRQFPADIVEFRADGNPIAFIQTVRFKDKLIFLFAGMDYKVSREYDTYLNILLHIVRTGIEADCSCIDLGQTAEAAKTRLGARLVKKHLHAAHSNAVGQLLLKATVGLLSYRGEERDHNVFK